MRFRGSRKGGEGDGTWGTGLGHGGTGLGEQFFGCWEQVAQGVWARRCHEANPPPERYMQYSSTVPNHTPSVHHRPSRTPRSTLHPPPPPSSGLAANTLRRNRAMQPDLLIPPAFERFCCKRCWIRKSPIFSDHKPAMWRQSSKPPITMCSVLSPFPISKSTIYNSRQPRRKKLQ